MSEKLNIMVIPFQKNSAVVVPKKVVDYVLPYARPLPSSYSHDALVGSIIYQNEKVPIVDLSVLHGAEGSELNDGGHRRLVIIPSLKNHFEFSSYAIIADDAPRVFHETKDAMRETNKEVQAPFYSCIELDELPDSELFVLDLEALENLIFKDEKELV